MHDFLNMIIIGIVQGLTEFLPVSSSGHLVIFNDLLGLESKKSLALNIFVHFGTLLAVFICFRRELLQLIKCLPKLPQHLKEKMPNQTEEQQTCSMVIYLILSAVPVGIIGLYFKDQIEEATSSTRFVYSCLLITSAVLYSLHWANKRTSKPQINLTKSLIIGIVQAFAILPGISRSGITITTARWLKISPELAGRFSFIMSIIPIAGATVLQLKDLYQQSISLNEILLYATAMISAAVSGYYSIRFLMHLIRRQKMENFAYYCLALGLLGLCFGN